MEKKAPKLPDLASYYLSKFVPKEALQVTQQEDDVSPETAYLRPGYNPGLETGSSSKTGSSWIGRDGYLSTGASVVNALSGLAGAYTGWKALKLGEEQFDWQKAAANRDLENQGLAYNTALMDRAAIGARLGGKNEADTAAILAAAEKNKMNTRPI